MTRSGDRSAKNEVTFLGDIPVDVVIELGRRRMVLKELAALDVDDIVELDQLLPALCAVGRVTDLYYRPQRVQGGRVLVGAGPLVAVQLCRDFECI